MVGITHQSSNQQLQITLYRVYYVRLNYKFRVLQVYYITCPEVTINFAHFPMTPTGREVTLIEQATGTCVDNAEVIDSPTYLCKGDGKWSLPTGGCKCKAGFEPDFDKQTCNGKSSYF